MDIGALHGSEADKSERASQPVFDAWGELLKDRDRGASPAPPPLVDPELVAMRQQMRELRELCGMMGNPF